MLATRYSNCYTKATLLSGELQFIQTIINSSLSQQILMGAGFANFALVHDDDAIAMLDGGEPVGDDQTLSGFAQNFLLIFRSGSFTFR